MTQETVTVERLDFTKPPLGYEVDTTTFTFTAPSETAASGHERCIANIDGTSKVSGRDQTLAAAWAHYKDKHDPPGMVTFSVDGEGVWWHWALSGARSRGDSYDSHTAARAAAWPWYETRLMTQETAPSVERLDFTKPPLGYEVDLDDDQEVNPGLWTWSTDGGRTRGAEPQGAEYEALEDAWSHYKGEHDPPGMRVVLGVGLWGFDVFQTRGLWDPSVRDGLWNKAAARAAAWSWYETRLALADKLDRADIACPQCGSREAHSYAIDERTESQPWCTECDVEMGALFDGAEDFLTRLLPASNEQVAEVERWLVDSTAEMPEVLRG